MILGCAFDAPSLMPSIYGDAFAEYLARHAPDRVTEAMSRVCADLGEGIDEFVAAASRRTMKRSEW